MKLLAAIVTNTYNSGKSQSYIYSFQRTHSNMETHTRLWTYTI